MDVGELMTATCKVKLELWAKLEVTKISLMHGGEHFVKILDYPS